jgi:hypothetical protein
MLDVMAVWPQAHAPRMIAATHAPGPTRPINAFTVRRDPPAVRIADMDPTLLADLPDELVVAARQHLVARSRWLEPGRWQPLAGDLPPRFDGWLGMLVLHGLLVRQVEVEGLRCCELLGPGDILRPWDEDDGTGTIECHSSWRVLEPTGLALLDANFARRACRWPSLTAVLMQRTLTRSRSQSILLAVTQARRADVRLRTLFSHLADRWGRVTPEGIVLPLHLTHSVIAQLTGLRRPSVSISLGELERSGEIIRLSKRSWLIAIDTG